MQIKKLFLNEINLSSNRVHRRNSRTFLKKVFGTFPSAILLPIEKFHATVTATWNKKMKSRMILRNSVSQCPLHLLSKWIALYYVVCLSVSMATSPFISTVWCSRRYKPIFAESLSSGDNIDRDEDLQDKYKDKDPILYIIS